MPGVAKRDYSSHRCECGDHAFAVTSKRGVVLVDVADEPLLRRPWQENNKGYAQCNDGKLHRIITGAPQKLTVDHANHDKLDNRRRNLRVCSNDENVRNRGKFSRGGKPHSRFKGVTLYERQGWVARITVDRRRIFLGAYGTEEDAAAAYDEAALRYHGEFALLNQGRRLSL